MNAWKNRLKNYNFWLGLISAILLILQTVFNYQFDSAYINEIISAVLGLFVVIGVIANPTKEEIANPTKEEIVKEEIKQEVEKTEIEDISTENDKIKEKEKENVEIQNILDTLKSLQETINKIEAEKDNSDAQF